MSTYFATGPDLYMENKALRLTIEKQAQMVGRLEPLAKRAEQAEADAMRLQLSLDVMTKRYEMAVAELATIAASADPATEKKMFGAEPCPICATLQYYPVKGPTDNYAPFNWICTYDKCGSELTIDPHPLTGGVKQIER